MSIEKPTTAEKQFMMMAGACVASGMVTTDFIRMWTDLADRTIPHSLVLHDPPPGEKLTKPKKKAKTKK